jgi:hypothetical protein
MKYLFFLFLLLSGFFTNAQQQGNASDSGASNLMASNTTNTVKINADSRLALVVNKPAPRAFVGRVKGFRVQIYNGNDRKIANSAKLNFMRSNPGIRSYLVYNNPQFRIRVGDFKSRKEALQLQRALSATYSPCMVVPDIINYATPRVNKPKLSDSTKPTTLKKE